MKNGDKGETNVSKEERYAKAPLLYIDQKTTGEVSATMQHHYRSPKVKEKNIQSSPSARETFQGEAQEDKDFKDKNVAEQINYLVNRPDFAPQLICEIKTKERVYRGIILRDEEGVVTIRSGRRRIEIPKEKVTSIRLVSL